MSTNLPVLSATCLRNARTRPLGVSYDAAMQAAESAVTAGASLETATRLAVAVLNALDLALSDKDCTDDTLRDLSRRLNVATCYAATVAPRGSR